jgi:hypothetical protein
MISPRFSATSMALDLGEFLSYTRSMLSRPRALPAGFIAPCLPINAP